MKMESREFKVLANSIDKTDLLVVKRTIQHINKSLGEEFKPEHIIEFWTLFVKSLS